MSWKCEFVISAVGPRNGLKTVARAFKKYGAQIDYIDVDDGLPWLHITGCVPSLEFTSRGSRPYVDENGMEHVRINLSRLSKKADVSFEVYAQTSGVDPDSPLYQEHICVANGEMYLKHRIPVTVDKMRVFDWNDANKYFIHDQIMSTLRFKFEDYLDDDQYDALMDEVSDMMEDACKKRWYLTTFKYGGFAWNSAKKEDIRHGAVWTSKPLMTLEYDEEW